VDVNPDAKGVRLSFAFYSSSQPKPIER
jgi:hypothetical protein